ncbi:hypothetical protein KUV80_12990 [Fictibacillus nanhaiensis]|uniref:hypothetical protein n=1 Tax=Fictibacillus nanhaiensis TaxID=742169 RepID=UPI001C97026E|nr:hypothetical protein [Fictibacillus nanhaiensis]MBY6037579.1 hypothetical protein [Fictibacillus nanhaiensis]
MDNTLFNENTHTDKKNKCDTCICELLEKLANDTLGLCTDNEMKFLVILKGASEPLSISSMRSTEFKLERFDRKSCCVVFSFMEHCGKHQHEQKRTIILDCRCICAIVCLGDKKIKPY